MRRLGRYLVHDRRLLLLTLVLLVPVAFAGAIQPLLVGLAISVLRNESSLPWLEGLSTSAAIRLIVLLMLGSVLLRFGLQRVQLFNFQVVGQRLTARIRDDLFRHALDVLDDVPPEDVRVPVDRAHDERVQVVQLAEKLELLLRLLQGRQRDRHVSRPR